MAMMPPHRCGTCRQLVTGPCQTCARTADRRRGTAAAQTTVPAQLSRQVRRLLRDEPAVSWDAAVARLAAKPGRGRSGHGDTGPAVSGADPLGAKRAKRGTA